MFLSQRSQCKFSEDYVGSGQSGIVGIGYGNEADLKRAVAFVGPISVAIDARSMSFRVRPHSNSSHFMIILKELTHTHF